MLRILGVFALSSAAFAADIDWVRLPGGAFVMGRGAQAHQVRVAPFELARTLVTQRQYRACVAAKACTPPEDYGDRFNGDDQPVIGVDWEQAKSFSKWVGGRLPTEAEWEYAARSAGKDRDYPWGSQKATCARAVISEGGLGCGRDATWPVCSKPAGNTEQGLCDMAGEAWEWVEDWFHPTYKGAPADGSAWVDPPGKYRAMRGGSWISGPSRARTTNRGDGYPGRWEGRSFRPAR